MMVLIIGLIGYIMAMQCIDYLYRHGRHEYYTRASPPPEIRKDDMVLDGFDLHLENETLHGILTRHHHYYASLENKLQQRFIKRLKRFMRRKIFIIKDDEAFLDMPVLVSASAIQLTFGLKRYLLSFYRYIRIHPAEYLAEGALRILAGNVENNVITVAWNHFLHGYKDGTDGSNVGLHEMSHALYFQKMVINGSVSRRFCKHYKGLLAHCHLASLQEKSGQRNLYSSYADSNLQEFWAESVELFFERPADLCHHYPSVYEALTTQLQQDIKQVQHPLLPEKLKLKSSLKTYFAR